MAFGLYGTLNIAKNALSAQQVGLSVTSNNVSNVGTAGYSRQELMLESFGYDQMGVRATGVRRVVDRFVVDRYRDQAGVTGFANAKADSLYRLETAAAELGTGSLGTAVSQLFADFRELAANPEDRAVRSKLLASGEGVAMRVRDAYNALGAEQENLDNTVGDLIGRSNSLIDEIRALNVDIGVLQAAGNDAPELEDQRSQAVLKLSEIMGAKSYTDDLGNFIVSTAAGITVVQGTAARHLQGQPNATTGRVDVYTQEGTQILLNGRINTGELGAALDVRDNDLAGRMTELDAFAFELGTSVNAVHSAGFGLDAAGGRNFFNLSATATGAAVAIDLDAAVVGNPDAVAAATDPLAVPGDGRNAQALADLESQNIVNGGTQDANGYLSDWVASIGQTSQRAESDRSEANTRMAAATRLQEGTSGVNLEEQMVLLTQYQRAFQAATKLVSTVDEMMQTILSM